MTKPKTNRDRFAQLCFALLLPGFFLYHSLVGTGRLPAFLGGYSSAMSGILLLPLSVAYVQYLLEAPRNRLPLDAIYFAFILYYATLLMMHAAAGTRSHAVAEQFGIAIQFPTLFMAARLTPIDDAKFRKFLLTCLLMITAVVASNADTGTFVIVALDLREQDTKLANYQAYAFVYSVILLYIVAATRARWQRILLYAIGIPTLFLNGARTEFIGTMVLVLLMEFLESRHKLRTVLISAVLIGIGIASLPILADMFPESRTVLLFLDASSDISANERAEMFAHGWRTIGENPFVGKFQSHAIGEHIHNALSAWVDLGLLGFVTFVALIAAPAVHLFFLQRLDFRNPTYHLAFSLSFQTALFAITAKHYTHQLFPLALGIYAQWLIQARARREEAAALEGSNGRPIPQTFASPTQLA